MKIRITMMAMGLALLAGCTETNEPRVDSSTHWLSACVDDGDCGSLACVCGVCTEVCDGDAVCGDIVDGAVCAGASTWGTCEVATAGVCSDACASASDCPSGVPACVDGACVATVTGGGDDAGADAGTDVGSDVGGGTDTGVDASPDAAEPCTEAECDPAPGAPNFTCLDGTIAGPFCERSALGVCGWIFTQCPSVTGCFGDDGCADGQVCNAADICLSDPECPECDVCYGWCTDPSDTCDRVACGDADVGDGAWRICEDGSLAGPVCFDSGEGCQWGQTYCAEDELP